MSFLIHHLSLQKQKLRQQYYIAAGAIINLIKPQSLIR